MSVSYSFHIGNGKNSLSSCAKIKSADKHNLRKYNSETFDKNKIVTIYGSDNIFKDVQNLYKAEFDEPLKIYNAGQKRKDRQIDDYLQYVSESNKDVAVEIIMQVGDMDFWKSVPYEYDEFDYSNVFFDTDLDFEGIFGKTLYQTDTINIYKEQLAKLQELLPDFKIANATIHLDESSPHMHVVGVPVVSGFKKGLSKQVSKRSVFTKESLSMLQEEMHSFTDEQMKPFGVDIRAKTEGHAYFTKELLELLTQIKRKKVELEELDTSLKNTLLKRTEADLSLEKLERDVIHLKVKKIALEHQIEGLEEKKEPLKDLTVFYIKRMREVMKELDEAIDDVDINNTFKKLDKSFDEFKNQATNLLPDNKEFVEELEELQKKAKKKITGINNNRSGR